MDDTNQKGPDAANIEALKNQSKHSSEILSQTGGNGNSLGRRLLKLRTHPGREIPVVDCTVRVGAGWEGTDILEFWCVHCQRRHTHGDHSAWLNPPGAILGHRSAHCVNKQSPHRTTGYFLRVAEVRP
jgi:hypothetical protein